METVTEAQRAEFRRKQIQLIELPADGNSTEALAAWLTEINPQSSTEQGSQEKAGKGDGDTSDLPAPINDSGKAWAVLVGVNQYEDPFIANLSVCVDDVTAVHMQIEAEYQSAKLLTDAAMSNDLPTRANIIAALSAAARTAEEGDLLLFYFSGHGEVDNGESHLLPRDARRIAIPHTAVAMRDVHSILEESAARAVVIIIDACHSGAAIGKSTAMSDEFIQRVFAEAEGTAVLASCKQGELSYEWAAQQQSVFTHYFWKHCKAKPISIKKAL